MNQDAEEENMAAKRSRWQDVDKTQIPVTQLLNSFLMSGGSKALGLTP